MGTPNSAFDHILSNQATKEVTANGTFDSLDDTINKGTSIATANADVTVTAAQLVGSVFFSFTGADTADRNIVVPHLNADNNSLQRLFVAENLTTGGFNLIFTTLSSPPGSTVSLKASDGACLLYSTGVDIILVGKLAGTTSGTFAAGNDSRITGAEQTSNKDAASGYAGLDANTKLSRHEVLGQYVVASLPVGTEGDVAYATNGRKVGEGGGAGTGVPVYFSNAAWRVYATDAAVAV